MNTRQVTKAADKPVPAQPVTTATPHPPRASIVRQFASKIGVEPEKLLSTLKDTAFKQPWKDGKPGPEVTEAQMLALLVVANEYGLNPFLKEIYAFPTKGGGIAPMVGYDGWVRLVQSQPSYNGEELIDGFDDRIGKDGNPRGFYFECTMWRKDRDRPTKIREYHNENWRDTDPWNNMPSRMTRNRAYIQCARMAFGFGGIYDPDEGERIANAMAIDVVPEGPRTKPVTQAPRARQVAHEQPQAHPQPTDPPPADAVADKDGAFQSLASEPESGAMFPDEDEAGSRG